MLKKITISSLPLVESLVGLFTIGVDSNNKSVKVGLEFVKEAADSANTAAESANAAAGNANTKATNASTAASSADAAANNANEKAAEAAALCEELRNNDKSTPWQLLAHVVSESENDYGMDVYGRYVRGAYQIRVYPNYFYLPEYAALHPSMVDYYGFSLGNILPLNLEGVAISWNTNHDNSYYSPIQLSATADGVLRVDFVDGTENANPPSQVASWEFSGTPMYLMAFKIN